MTYERYIFNRRSQEECETFDAFAADLRRLVKTCEYGALEDSIITDRIVIGIRDDSTRKKLLLKRSLDLQSASDICRAAESASRQLKELHGTDTVESLRADKNRRHQSRSRGHRDSSHSRDPSTFRDNFRKRDSDRKCRFCGQHHRFSKNECPAYGKYAKLVAPKIILLSSAVRNQTTRTRETT